MRVGAYSRQARRDEVLVWDLRTWGTFTRVGPATYLIGAPTDGSSPFLLDAFNGARRLEDRGDGNGPMLLIEGSRHNLFQDSESFASWTLSNSTITNNVGTAPDGTNVADRVQTTSGGTGANRTFAGVTPSLDWIGTHYRRAPSGTVATHDAIGNSGGWASANAALGTTWERAIMQALPSNGDASMGMWVADGRALGAPVTGGLGVAGARDTWDAFRQLEQASFPSSYIRSIATVGGTTRAADRLSGPTSTVPDYVLNGTFTFAIAPIFSSAAGVRHAADQCLFSFAEDDSERVLFVVSGGSLYLRVIAGGATKVTSSALTFSAHQKLTVTLDAVAGTLTVAGATSGNGTASGTPWTRTPGATTYVGTRQGGTQPAFVRFGVESYTPSDEKIVLFCLGQSNMQGYSPPNRTQSIPGQIAGATQNDFRRVRKVEYAVGGTTLAVQWNKTGGTAYAGALAAWDAALAADPDLATYTPVIVWGQGESDAGSSIHSAAYGTNLANLFTNIGTDRPFFAGCKRVIHALYDENGIDSTPGWPNNATIRAAQVAYAAANPSDVALVETSDLLGGDDPTYDTVHFTEAATDVLARRDAAAIRGWFA